MAFPVDIPLGEQDTDAPSQNELSPEQLRAQLAAAEETIQRQNQDLSHERSRLDQFLSRSPETPAETPPPPLGVMPDMIEKPDEYRIWMAEKDRRDKLETNRRFDAEREERKREIANAESRASLWQIFQANHPAHAKLTALANPAYQRVSQRSDAPSDVTFLAKAIADEMDSMAGGSVENLKKPADRSAGSSGGERPSPAKPKQETEVEDGFASTHKAISAWQTKYGLQ